MKLKRTILLLFYLLAAVIVGAMIASVCSHVSFLKWLSYSGSIGFSPPFVLDLAVLQITFGFSMSISVAQVFTILLSIFLYNKTRIK